MSAGKAGPAAVVVMGVSGSGKTTVGLLLAELLGWEFRDGDSFHPPANVAKMRAGTPLTDADRWPWLDAIAAHVAGLAATGGRTVIACSALKRVYRDRLRAGGAAVRFVHLAGAYDVIDGRLKTRTGHFMPAKLLASQFAALEVPGADEEAITVSIEAGPEEIARKIAERLHGFSA